MPKTAERCGKRLIPKNRKTGARPCRTISRCRSNPSDITTRLARYGPSKRVQARKATDKNRVPSINPCPSKFLTRISTRFLLLSKVIAATHMLANAFPPLPSKGIVSPLLETSRYPAPDTALDFHHPSRCHLPRSRLAGATATSIHSKCHCH
jgi:hypothetical protein